MPPLSTGTRLLAHLASSLLLAAPAPAQNTSTSPPPAAPLCTSSSSASLPNPFAANAYPGLGTGTANGTVAILPIPYATARQVVPAKYPILQHVYQELFPGFVEANLYPMYIEMIQDHDIRLNGTPVAPDFSRASLLYPFVDRLMNGHTSFRFGAPILISPNPVVAANEPALQETYEGTFDPPCVAYAAVPGQDQRGVTYMDAWVGDGQAQGKRPSFETQFHRIAESPYSLSAFQNITNQPLFGNGTVPGICDEYVEIRNTSLTTGVNAPVPVVGDVTVRTPFFKETQAFSRIFGFRYDVAWVDRPGVPCTSLAG